MWILLGLVLVILFVIAYPSDEARKASSPVQGAAQDAISGVAEGILIVVGGLAAIVAFLAFAGKGAKEGEVLGGPGEVVLGLVFVGVIAWLVVALWKEVSKSISDD